MELSSENNTAAPEGMQEIISLKNIYNTNKHYFFFKSGLLMDIKPII